MRLTVAAVLDRSDCGAAMVHPHEEIYARASGEVGHNESPCDLLGVAYQSFAELFDEPVFCYVSIVGSSLDKRNGGAHTNALIICHSGCCTSFVQKNGAVDYV